MTLLIMLACAGTADTGDTGDTGTGVPCTEVQGTLEICVWFDLADAAPQANAKAYASMEGDDEPLEGFTGDDGCLRIQLPAGTWEVWGATEDYLGWCVGESEQVILEACEVGHADVMTSDGCIG